MEKTYCACGCGEEMSNWVPTTRNGKTYEKGYFRFYIKGHNSRGKLNPMFGKSARKGQTNTPEHRQKISASLKGIKRPYARKNLPPTKFGSENPVWKGGGMEWWRTQALERDNHTCQICLLRDEEIMHVDHIKPKALFPELRFELSNLRTICPNCHERKSRKEKYRI